MVRSREESGRRKGGREGGGRFLPSTLSFSLFAKTLLLGASAKRLMKLSINTYTYTHAHTHKHTHIDLAAGWECEAVGETWCWHLWRTTGTQSVLKGTSGCSSRRTAKKKKLKPVMEQY